MALELKGYLTYRVFQLLKMAHDIRYLYGLLWKEVENFELKEFFRERSQSVEKEVHNLEEALRHLGTGLPLPVPPERTRALEAAPETLPLMAERGGNPVTQGIIQEHQMFMRLDPTQAAVDVHDLLEAGRIEHLEVIAYEHLIALAGELDQPEVRELLEQNRQAGVEERTHVEDRLRPLLEEFRFGRKPGEETREAA